MKYKIHTIHKKEKKKYTYLLLIIYCEQELSDLDMSINVQKTCCLRIGPRHNGTCATISTSFGIAIPWVDKVKYLGIFKHSHTFRCDLDHAKRSLYRSANAIFGKVGRAANEEVVVQLLVSKYMYSNLNVWSRTLPPD